MRERVNNIILLLCGFCYNIIPIYRHKRHSLMDLIFITRVNIGFYKYVSVKPTRRKQLVLVVVWYTCFFFDKLVLYECFSIQFNLKIY